MSDSNSLGNFIERLIRIIEYDQEKKVDITKKKNKIFVFNYKKYIEDILYLANIYDQNTIHMIYQHKISFEYFFIC
jgi:hypothetical protein